MRIIIEPLMLGNHKESCVEEVYSEDLTIV